MRNNPNNKSEIISFRANAVERMQIELRALRSKQNLSQYLRSQILKK